MSRGTEEREERDKVEIKKKEYPKVVKDRAT